MRLSCGSKVPADLRIIESHDLKFDKSMLTGESEDIEATCETSDESYSEAKNIAFMSTLITSGEGTGIVIGTGQNTMLGKIAHLTGQSSEQMTMLQLELHRFVFKLGMCALATALFVIVLWTSWLHVDHAGYIDLSGLMVNTIAVLVSFIPEGLPVCITLSLLIIAKRMAKQGVLVKNLGIVETLSCVNVLASDKTGTLTQNKMLVTRVTAGLDVISDFAAYANDTRFKTLLAVSSICNNAKQEENAAEPVGNATDIALLKFSAHFLDKTNIGTFYSLLDEVPFSSRLKYMMRRVKPKNIDLHELLFAQKMRAEDSLILLKGAPDILIHKCSTMSDSTGNEVELTKKGVDELVQIQNEWCLRGERVLMLCMKKVNDFQLEDSDMANAHDFCLLGLVSLIDPPREGIADAIGKFRQAGIRVLMLTGDYALTATAIASQIGIFTRTQCPHHTLKDVLEVDTLVNSSPGLGNYKI